VATKNDKVNLMIATKTLEDSLQRLTGEAAFDAWLDEIPLDVDPKHYASALYWMYTSLAKYRNPTPAQIDNAYTLTRINLIFNPAMGGKDQGRGYFTPA
jgi:hypothetical protein